MTKFNMVDKNILDKLLCHLLTGNYLCMCLKVDYANKFFFFYQMKSDVGHRLPAETLSSDISIIIYIFFSSF